MRFLVYLDDSVFETSLFPHKRTSSIHRFALHNRRDVLARCATKTIAIRNSDNAVWQSAAMGMDQDGLAAA